MGDVRVVVQGLGFIAVQEHLPNLARMPGVEVAGVVSRSAERARSIAEQYGARAYTSLAEALEREKPDFVDICTETHRHRECALEAIEAGVHVFLEKPIAPSVEEAREIVEAARRKGVLLMVGHVLRFWPEYVAVKRAVEEGKVGEVSIARAYRYVPFPAWSYGKWHKDLSKSGGVFVDLGIHDVDFLRWTLGEVEEVFARGYAPEGSSAHTHVHALLKFRSGAIAYVESSWFVPEAHKFYTYLEVVGEKGLLTVDNRSAAGVHVYRGGDYSYFTPHPRSGYYLELKAFVDAIRRGEEPPVTGEDAARSLEVVLAAVKSVSTGRPVRLS